MNTFPWITLDNTQQIGQIIEKSKENPQVIFKHSTRCNISSVAKNRFEKSEPIVGVEYHLLDLIANRQVSAAIADKTGVYHESPQIILLVNGVCIFDESHFAIEAEEIKEQLTINTKG
jgi:bacillithiol system protein YtxJ